MVKTDCDHVAKVGSKRFDATGAESTDFVFLSGWLQKASSLNKNLGSIFNSALRNRQSRLASLSVYFPASSARPDAELNAAAHLCLRPVDKDREIDVQRLV